MHILIVHIQVKPESVDAFKQATAENARQSAQEFGVARFDVFQQIDDPTKFTLVEVYRDADGPPAHRQTPHYRTWRAAAEPMMAGDRTRIELTNVFPDDRGW